MTTLDNLVTRENFKIISTEAFPVFNVMGVTRNGVGLQTNDVVTDGLQYGLTCRDLIEIGVHTELETLPMRPGQCIHRLPQLIVPLTTIQKVCWQLVCFGDKIFSLWEWVNCNLNIFPDKLAYCGCINLVPVMYQSYPCFNLLENCNLLSSTISHTQNPKIFGIKPCIPNNQTFENLIQLCSFLILGPREIDRHHKVIWPISINAP